METFQPSCIFALFINILLCYLVNKIVETGRCACQENRKLRQKYQKHERERVKALAERSRQEAIG